jgi:hypothetical protein
VEKQVTRTGHYLRQPTPELAQKIYASDDDVDNLKTFVQAKCFCFVLDESLVREMYLKSRYILEVVVSQLDMGVGRFRFPREVLLG